jgi:hypothetical protein
MADNNGQRITYGSVGTTAETSYLTTSVNQVAVRNTHSSQTLSVRVFTANSPAAAQALADATDAVASADETWFVPAGARVVVFKSPRAKFIGLSVLGSGASTTYVTEGSDWFD